jgi:hypothetical protein
MDRIAVSGWAPLARVAANLAFGLSPFVVLEALPVAGGGPWNSSTAVLWGMTAAFALCLHRKDRQAVVERGSPFRQLLSCLLLGSSLAAIPWHVAGASVFPIAAGVGFLCRWWLYILEAKDLAEADRRKMALPCLATRIRRSFTWMTGALIPVLLFARLPGFPLLALSFALTAGGQWIGAYELRLKELQVRH